MHADYDRLTDKEKHTLPLLLRGHDAKSSARALGLSVHTVNERLRDARRKLGVTSSREAARIVLAAEADNPEMLVDMPLGDAAAGGGEAQAGVSATGHRVTPRFAVPLIGVTAMTALLAAFLLPASPLSILPAGMADGIEVAAEPAEAAAAANAAHTFLVLVDQGNWVQSYAATGDQFRALNTLERWSEVSERVRPPLGTLVSRTPAGNEFVPAPPHGYRLVKFRSTYTGGKSQTESLSLAWEDGAWKVVGITFD